MFAGRPYVCVGTLCGRRRQASCICKRASESVFCLLYLLMEEIRLEIFGSPDYTVLPYNQGTPFTPVKPCLHFWGLRENLFGSYGASCIRLMYPQESSCRRASWQTSEDRPHVCLWETLSLCGNPMWQQNTDLLYPQESWRVCLLPLVSASCICNRAPPAESGIGRWGSTGSSAFI